MKILKEKVHFKTPDDALNQKNKVWVVRNFLHSCFNYIAEGEELSDLNDKITLYNLYT